MNGFLRKDISRDREFLIVSYQSFAIPLYISKETRNSMSIVFSYFLEFDCVKTVGSNFC